jgi:diguanylate cyclase (GGDEF)-like protein
VAVIGAATIVQNSESAWADLPWALSSAVSVLVAMVSYTVINRALPSVALIINRVPLRELRGTREDNLIELATLCLGGLVAIAALHEPWLCVLAVAPMVTLQRGALVAELETAATVDAKTGLLNAVAWEHLTQRELSRAERENHDVAILIIDIDRFKLVNDQYGHMVGDQVLRKVGKVLAAGVREYDTVGRFGGEEFVAVLPNAGDADALVVAERLRSRVNELRIAALLDGPAPEGAAEHALAVSIGVSCTRHDGREVTSLLVAADAALYRAKSGGRNRVVLADRGTGPSLAPIA